MSRQQSKGWEGGGEKNAIINLQPDLGISSKMVPLKAGLQSFFQEEEGKIMKGSVLELCDLPPTSSPALWLPVDPLWPVQKG